MMELMLNNRKMSTVMRKVFKTLQREEKKNPTNQRFVMHVIKSITPKMNAHKLGAAWKFFHFNFVICRLIIFFFFCDACSCQAKFYLSAFIERLCKRLEFELVRACARTLKYYRVYSIFNIINLCRQESKCNI